MRLTIITINRNNAVGLEKTLKSVASQTWKDYEHIVVDGASTDGSRDIIQKYAESFSERVKWVSEPDNGIYNAMNKGISMASGEYVQFLNSGDCLVSDIVIEMMLKALEENGYPSIIYGNMLKDMQNGKVLRDKCFGGKQITLKGMYHGCLNHSPAFIRRDLFDKYDRYDENLRICSDWEWYMKAIVLGEESPYYIDFDVTLFDMTGISESNHCLLDKERRSLLRKMIPNGILSDYDYWYDDIIKIERIKRYSWVYGLFSFIERVLFKYEKARKDFLRR